MQANCRRSGLITTLNNLTNIRYTWQPNLEDGPQDHSHANASQCTDCAEQSFPVTSSEGITKHDADLGFLSCPLLTLIMCTLRLIFTIHGCIVQLVSRETGRELWWNSRGVTYGTSHFQTSFSFASLFWIEAITCLMWPSEIWWLNVRRHNCTVACCNAGRKPSLILIPWRRKWKRLNFEGFMWKKSNSFCIWRSWHPVCLLFATRFDGNTSLSPCGTKSFHSVTTYIWKMVSSIHL